MTVEKRDRISVAMFSNTVARGGAEEHILTLLRGLDRGLFRLHLICSPQVAEALGHDLPEDVALFPLDYRKPTEAGGGFRLAAYLRRHRIEILHSHLFYSSFFASPVGRMCRVPVILETPHVREHWRAGWKANYAIDRFAGRFVDYYIAVSEANGRYLVEEKRLPARKVKVIQNGCSLDRFDPERHAPAGMRESLNIGIHDPILLVLGRLEPQKGHRILLQAMPEVCRQAPHTKLICAGDGALRDELASQTAALGLQEAVRFVGFQPNVPDWLALADLVVLPSFYEGLPLVAIESLAAGRSMVATAVDGTPEVVVDGRTGLTVPPGDPARLAEAIVRLLLDDSLRSTMERAGAAWVRERFTQQRQLRETQELYLQAYAEKTGIVRLLPQPPAIAEEPVAMAGEKVR